MVTSKMGYPNRGNWIPPHWGSSRLPDIIFFSTVSGKEPHIRLPIERPIQFRHLHTVQMLDDMPPSSAIVLHAGVAPRLPQQAD